jgi:hypothetical protein
MRILRQVCLLANACACVLVVGLFTALPVSAATLTVCASGCAFTDLQEALNTAQPGDTILLRAGETFVGHFRLPVKNNPGGAYIVIRSDAPDASLPAAGTRLIPAGYPGANTSPATLARLVGRGGQWKTTPVLEAELGAHHYRFQFLDIDGLAQEGWETIVQLGTSSGDQWNLDQVPYDIVLDRVYVHGHPAKGQKRCVALNGRNLTVENSFITNCSNFSYDSQAIAGFNGPGPFKIANNHLEASGENVLFGGADPRIPGLLPSDIEITRNHFVKPLAWRDAILAAPGAPSPSVIPGGGALGAGMHYFKVVAVLEVATDVGLSAPSEEQGVWVDSGGSGVNLSWGGVAGADRYRVYVGESPGGQNRFIETSGAQTSMSYTGDGEVWQGPPSGGTRWNVKNLLELKNAQRVLIDGNVFEQLWPASQTGYAVVLTPRNSDGTAPWTVVRDVTFSNNILRHVAGGINILGYDDTNGSQPTARINIRNNLVYDISSAWGGSSHFVMITGGPTEVKIDHNTIFHDGMVVIADSGPSYGFQFTNNVAPHNEYGVFGSGAGLGTAAMNAYFPDGTLRRNALGGGPASQYPADNVFPDMGLFAAQFVNIAAGDFRLVPASQFAGAGTDGKDLGVDFSALAAALPPGVLPGVDSGGNPAPTPSSPPPTPSSPPPTPSSPAPLKPTAISLPGVIQAEDFDDGGAGVAYSDTSSGNEGGQYRSTDVDIEPSADVDGGYNVGWIDAGEWLKYTVNVGAAGTYSLEARVSTLGTGGTFHVEANGSDITGPIAIPATGGWQAWTTVTRSVTLDAGPQIWRVVFDSRGPDDVVGNINYIRVTAAGAGGGGTATPPSGGGAQALARLIQAEDFDDGGHGVAYVDTTPGNYGEQHRATDVDIEPTTDEEGGYNVGWIDPGEWLKYTVDVSAPGTYAVDVRVASAGAGGSFHIEVNGVDVTGPLVIPDTGSWQSWTTIRRSGVSLAAGPQVWRLVMDSGGAWGAVGNVNYIAISPQ